MEPISRNEFRKLLNKTFVVNEEGENMAKLEVKIEKEKVEKAITNEEWIWVEGYKGTEADMTCRGYQFELRKQFDIDNDESIETCKNGFHLCLDLKDVFNYYKIGDGNRFFKVNALVRKSDYEKCKVSDAMKISSPSFYWYSVCSVSDGDKLAAKSIIFVEEVPRERLYKYIRENYANLREASDACLEMAITKDIAKATAHHRVGVLIDDGYSLPLATYMSNDTDLFDRAHALASVEGLSTDVKIMSIFCALND